MCLCLTPSDHHTCAALSPRAVKAAPYEPEAEPEPEPEADAEAEADAGTEDVAAIEARRVSFSSSE